MNNPQATRPDCHQIATLVAAELPGKWSVNAGGGDRCTKITRDSDGLEIAVANDNAFNAPHDRIDIHQSWHTPAWTDTDGTRHDPTGYGESLPGIKVTAKKRATVIARDIVRRLLPDAERFHAIGVAHVQSCDASHAKRDRLAVALGMAPATQSRHSSRIDNPSETHELTESHPEASYPRAEVTVSSSGVKIEVDGLTAEQARAVLAVLGIEAAAPARVAA